MTTPTDSAQQGRDRDAVMVQALEEFRIARAKGQPNRPALLARYPQIAAELAACLDAWEFLDHAVVDLPAFPAASQPFDLLQSAGGDGRLSSPGSQSAVLHAVVPLGDFRIVREIGRGGMGIVYEAEQLSLGRRVALKVLPFASALDPKQLARFKNEAQATAHLRHPNIVQVHSVGYERSVHFYAMEFIDGQNLAAAIEGWRHTAGQTTVSLRQSSRRPTVSEINFFRRAAQLGVQAAVALEHAHQIGVIHRDIKPANLLVDDGGRLWVTDFGLASIRGETQLTRTGDLLGTVRYMSPEQALGNRSGVDHRTDIYSLGATLYEVLTLEPAFSGQDPQGILRRIAHDDPPALRRVNGAIPVELEIIVQKAMRKAPQERYQSAQELADDLNRFLNDEPILARRATPWQRLTRWARRHRTMAWSAAIVLALAVVLLIVSLTVSNHYILKAKNRAQGAETLALERLFDARLAQAQARRMSRQPGQRLLSWEALTEAAHLARQLGLAEHKLVSLRDEAVACLALLDLRTEKEWPGWPLGSSAALAFTSDLSCYARSDLHGNISIRSVDGNRELTPLPGKEAAAVMQFAPGDHLLAVCSFRPLSGQSINFVLWDWRRQQVILRPQVQVSDGAVAFSRDGRELALGHTDEVVRIYEATTGKLIQQLAVGFACAHLAFHPDGHQIALCRSSAGEWQTWDSKSGRRLGKWSAPTRLWKLAWHADGGLLAGAGHDGRVYLWDPKTGMQQTVLNGHQGDVTGLAFAPRGERSPDVLLSWGWDGISRLWDPWTGRELLRFSGGGGQFSADGTRLAFRNGHALVLADVLAAQEYRSLPRIKAHPDEKTHDGDVSPDGRWLAVAGGPGVHIWDLSQGKPSGLLPLGLTHAVRFHPSGNELYTTGPSGLYRWPVRLQAQELHLGPARKLPAPGNLGRLSLDQKGRTGGVVAVGARVGGRVFDIGQPSTHRVTLPHENAESIAMSPDGRWVATGTFHGFGVKIWEAAAGRLARHLLPEERFAGVEFSPDGRWLVIGTESAFGMWEVESWKLVREIAREHGGPDLRNCAFSPDGKLLALTLSPSVVELRDASWRPLARLQTPDQDIRSLIGFANTEKLVIVTRNDVLKVWDLRLVRERLQTIGLDLEGPPLTPPPAGGPTSRVVIDKGEFEPTTARQAHERGLEYARSRRWKETIEWLTRAIELNPEGLAAIHQRDRAHEALGRWQSALDDYEAALELQPDSMPLLVDRGRMLVRLGRGEEALADLSVATEQKPDDWSAWAARADLYADLARWDDVASDFDRALVLAPNRTYVGLKLALARLAQEDREGYSQACERLHRVIGKAPSEELGRYATWACVVAPGSPNLEHVIAILDRFVKDRPDDPDHLTNLGAALFRAGRHADALERLTAAESRFQHARSPTAGCSWPWSTRGWIGPKSQADGSKERLWPSNNPNRASRARPGYAASRCGCCTARRGTW